MEIIKTLGGTIKAWVHKNEYGLATIEASAMQQLFSVASLPFLHPNGVAVMPDVHAGIGATVGTVLATLQAIVPAAVGVDIGCGMMAFRLSGATANDIDEKKLNQIFSEIESNIPTGFGCHVPGMENMKAATNMYKQFVHVVDPPHVEKMQTRRKNSIQSIVISQFGSLGGGNHFIELCVDENQELWVMLHSGSRGIGNMIGSYFIERAREDMISQNIYLPERDLAYFTTDSENFQSYWKALTWAQEYARENRNEMMRRILGILRGHLPTFSSEEEAINCHHNYASKEMHYGTECYVTRKGAIRAGLGDLGIIPGSMGQRSFIVRGKGNPESYSSCSHGAGRIMSRGAAKRHFTVQDLVEQTAGVVCRKDEHVLDEIPGAYKDIDQVMANQADLIDIVHTLKQVLCVKGVK